MNGNLTQGPVMNTMLRIAVPMIAHAAGYFVGMRKEEKLQAQLEATNAEEKAKKKKRK